MPGRLNWTIVPIPFDAAKIWGNRGQLRVRGEINGYEFQTSLFPDGKGGHYLLVNRQMQKGGHAQAGNLARFLLKPDSAKRAVGIPAELLRELRQSKPLMRFFESFNNSNRNWIAQWVAGAKRAETRKRRAEQIAERLMETLEAERELPPMLRIALARNAKARAGWEKIPPGQRRAHLLGIFYYRNVEARTRRVEKAIQMMEQYAEGKAARKRASEDDLQFEI